MLSIFILLHNVLKNNFFFSSYIHTTTPGLNLMSHKIFLHNFLKKNEIFNFTYQILQTIKWKNLQKRKIFHSSIWKGKEENFWKKEKAKSHHHIKEKWCSYQSLHGGGGGIHCNKWRGIFWALAATRVSYWFFTISHHTTLSFFRSQFIHIEKLSGTNKLINAITNFYPFFILTWCVCVRVKKVLGMDMNKKKLICATTRATQWSR